MADKPIKPRPDQIPSSTNGESEGRKRGLFGRFNNAFQDALESGRGEGRADGLAPPDSADDDLAMRRTRPARGQRMVVPEGVVIQGSLNSESETEISGRVNGDVTVEGRLLLGPRAVVDGTVRAGAAKVEGSINGKVECTQELDLGNSGHLNADAIAGKRMTISGSIDGNVTCGGMLRLTASSKVEGNIRARTLVIEEGAVYNGSCVTGAPTPATTRS